jgi:hypothetical protein
LVPTLVALWMVPAGMKRTSPALRSGLRFRTSDRGEEGVHVWRQLTDRRQRHVINEALCDLDGLLFEAGNPPRLIGKSRAAALQHKLGECRRDLQARAAHHR